TDNGTITVQATDGGTLTISLSGTTSATLDTTVSATGAATGSITSTSPPPGFVCSTGTCTHTFTASPVALTATPGANSAFVQWTGACSGSSPTCSVTMDGAKTVGAQFAPAYALSVMVGVGGSVQSSTAGIDCPGDCTENYVQGATVTLNA